MRHILHLNLHREWFAAIAAGTKTVEYRDQSVYWRKRLEGRAYDIVRFRNGYATRAPEMDVEYLGIRKTRAGGKRKYAIRLGSILRIRRWKG